MKILQVVTSLHPAGAERVVVDLSRGLATRGHAVEVVSLKPVAADNPLGAELRTAEIPLHSLGLTRATPWRAGAIRPLLARLDPEVVHAHLFHANLLTRMTGGGRRYRLVNTMHNADRRAVLRWRYLADRLTLQRGDVLTLVSRSARDFHARQLRVSPTSLPVVYNGVRPPKPLPPDAADALRREWDVDGCARVLGSVGRLVEQKGYARLLEMLPALAQRVPAGERWGLVILGDGPEADRLERLAARAPEALAVRLPGYRPDAARCLGAFDLFLMPSLWEGFGLTAVEAMGHGIPVLAADVDALPELMERYPGGEVVEFADPGRVGEAITKLLADPAPRVPQHPFTLDAMVEGYLAVYADPGMRDTPPAT